jgi:hypothetical protein
MKTKQTKGRAPRAKGMAGKQRDKKSHDSQLDTHLKSLLANQIKGLRGDMSQEAFGKLIGKPQSVVSRLEDPDYGKVTLQTLLDIASKLDVALIVRFASHSDYLKITKDTSLKALWPSTCSMDEIEKLKH